MNVASLGACADRKQTWLVAVLVAALSTVTGCGTSGLSLVERGDARVAVVLPAEPEPNEQRAADELVEHLRLITGAEVLVVSADEPISADLSTIRLGGAADPALDEAILVEGDNPSAFALVVDEEGGVDIRGLSDEGTLFGAYELLEQLGVRWYHPGELGRVIPDHRRVSIPFQRTIQVPSMDYRRLQHVSGGEWPSRVRLGGAQRSTGAHNIPPFRGTAGRRLFESNPEYYGLSRGERRFRQVCVSNPDVLRLAIENLRERLENDPELKYVGMGPNDGGGYCECENCKALDQGVFDPFYNAESMTDRYIWFFNQMLDALEDDFPDLHIVWYVYARHMMPPAIEPNPRIVGVFAPISLDRIRGMDNPMSPDRHTLRWLIESWSETNPNEMYYRGYYNNLACPQFPLSQIDRIRHETPAFREKGINVMRVETIAPSWAVQTPSIYLAARMMWDVNTDVDALLEEFYTKYYGPASGPMRRYHEMLDEAFRDTPYFTGSSYVYFPIFMDHPRRDEMRNLLYEAASAASGRNGLYAERIRAVRLGWDRMETFLDMIAARNDHDFVTAFRRMNDFYHLTDEMVDSVLETDEAGERELHRLLAWRERTESRGSYFNRFFRQPVVTGYQRAAEFGEIVATLPDEWDFLIDPAEIGEIAGYQRPGELGGNWQPIKTTSRSWSDQGLHYYKGAAWYRTSVDIPAEYEGRPLYLWFGGVDNIAHVWINGQFVGTSREPAEGLPGVPGSFRPFDMPATNAARFGQENWVVVKVENISLAELGTGGILAPVMFWSPNDPYWQPAE